MGIHEMNIAVLEALKVNLPLFILDSLSRYFHSADSKLPFITWEI